MADTTEQSERSSPDDAALPTPETDPRRQQISDYFLEFLTQEGRWSAPVLCPVCRTFDQWQAGDVVDTPLRYIPGRVFSCIPITCGNCSYTLFFNGVAADVFDINGEPKRSERLNEPQQLQLPESEGEAE